MRAEASLRLHVHCFQAKVERPDDAEREREGAHGPVEEGGFKERGSKMKKRGVRKEGMKVNDVKKEELRGGGEVGE